MQRPVERKIQGVVESVDAKLQMISLKTQGKASKKVAIAWKSHTHLHDAACKNASSDILKAGMTVMMKYRSHIAGATRASEMDA